MIYLSCFSFMSDLVYHFAESKEFFLSDDTGLVWRDVITVAIMIGFAAIVLHLFFRLFKREVEGIAVCLWVDFRCTMLHFYPSITKYELQSSFKSIVDFSYGGWKLLWTIYLLCALLQGR
ncbi:hypothetical protein ACEQPO_11825 [Bacillus sp. SL00103]